MVRGLDDASIGQYDARTLKNFVSIIGLAPGLLSVSGVDEHVTYNAHQRHGGDGVEIRGETPTSLMENCFCSSRRDSYDDDDNDCTSSEFLLLCCLRREKRKHRARNGKPLHPEDDEVEYILTIGMMLGLRVAVGRQANPLAKPELTVEDFYQVGALLDYSLWRLRGWLTRTRGRAMRRACYTTSSSPRCRHFVVFYHRHLFMCHYIFGGYWIDFIDARCFFSNW